MDFSFSNAPVLLSASPLILRTVRAAFKGKSLLEERLVRVSQSFKVHVVMFPSFCLAGGLET